MSIQPNGKLMVKYIISIILFGILLTGPIGGIGMLIAMDEGGNPQTVFLIIALVNLAWMITGLFSVKPYYNSIRYEIEDDEVIARMGIITKSVKHVPYRTVTNLEIKRGPLDRLLGIGNLHIQTAGMSGQTGAEEVLVGLVNVDEIYEKVVVMLRRYRGAMSANGASEDPLTEEATLAAILDEIRAIRQAVTAS